MLIRINRFQGARPRRDPGQLAQFEAQAAENARLWSGVLGSWRRPSDVLDVGTNALRWSNNFADAAWTQTGLSIVTANAVDGPDGSHTADKLVESSASSTHTVKQTAAKTASAQSWVGAVSMAAAERLFGYIAVSDGAGNDGHAIINLTTGAVTLQAVAGNFASLVVTVAAEANGFWRIHLKVLTNTGTAVQLAWGAALNGTTFVYAGSGGSGIYGYGASLRQSIRPGAYRETYDVALPSIASIYLYKDQYWFVSSDRASFVKGPIQGDTTDAVYYTGAGAPHPSVTYDPIAYSGNGGRGDMPRQRYTCGLPAPLSAPIVAIQPQTGSVSGVTNVLLTMANQTVAEFTTATFTSDGYTVVPRCRFVTTIQTTTVTSFVVLHQILRAGVVIAEQEHRVNLNVTSGVTTTDVTDVELWQLDAAPASSSNQYTFKVTVTAASGTFTSITYNHQNIQVRYAKARIATGTHPFRVGDHITVAGVLGFEVVNQQRMEVIAVESNAVWVDVGGNTAQTYASGGTWTRDYLPEELQDTGWVVTFLTQIGNHVQEGPPSPVSSLIAIGSGQPVLVSGLPTAAPSDGGTYNITGKRLYRSNVDSQGNAAFQFVTELAIGTASYTDSLRFVELGEVLPSDSDDDGLWSKPPADLKELTALHNGMLAGISGNMICFSVPFQPHAWPSAFRIPVNFTPVGLGPFGETLGVMCRGKPTIMVGTEPGSMRPIPTELKQPCMSVTGIVDMGDYIVYPGDDGLIMMSSARMGNVTTALFTKDEWAAFNPSSFIAGEYDGRYVCFFTRVDGTRGGFILDPKEAEATFTTLDFYASACWTDDRTGDLYVVYDEKIAKWDAHARDRFRKRWRSRRWSVEEPVCPAYGRVVAATYPVDFTLYSNPDPDHPDAFEAVCTKTVQSGQPFVLPSGYLGSSFELELQERGGGDVKEMAIASSVKELVRVR